MTWADNDFPRADDPTDVGWFISYWKIVKCDSGCQGDYRLESRQFQHLIKAATEEEALAELEHFVENKRASGDQPSRKGFTLYLSKVVKIVEISDRTGKLVDG